MAFKTDKLFEELAEDHQRLRRKEKLAWDAYHAECATKNTRFTCPGCGWSAVQPMQSPDLPRCPTCRLPGSPLHVEHDV